MRACLMVIFLIFLLTCPFKLSAAEKTPVGDLYMRLLVAAVEPALENQSEYGAYYPPREREKTHTRSYNEFNQMVIYPLAYLWATRHSLNPYHGSKQLLESVKRNGDLLTGFEPETFWPMSHWLVYAWMEAYDLIKEHLSPEQQHTWLASFERWCSVYAGYLEKCEGKRDFTAVQLGTSPNHYSYYAAAVYRGGQILNRPEWVELAVGAFKNLLRSQHPDGYWAEHHGPVNRYTWLTLDGVGLYYAFSGDAEALEALRRAKDFLLNFTYPDGSAVSVIDERNRYGSSVAATRGLHALSHFPDGRRFCRIMTRKLIDRLDKERKLPVGAVELSRYVDAIRYTVQGPETPAPQELDSYEARLISGAYLMRRGPWIVCLSGIISPPWEGNRFFLDRYTYLEIWHAETGLLIGGGNTKRQPQIATVLMEPSHGNLDFWPRSSRITASADSAVLELALDKFRAAVAVQILDRRKLAIRVDFTETTEPILWPNRYECNLQLQLKPGREITTGHGTSYTLSENRLGLAEEQVGGALESDHWRITVPQGKTSLRFPFMPFYNYDIDGHGGMGTAVGILSSAVHIEEGPLKYTVEIK